MFKTVLIAVDVSEEAETQRILSAAKALTADWDCASHVINVVPSVGMAVVGSFLSDDFEARSKEAAHVQLMEAIADANLNARTHVLTGKVYDMILRRLRPWAQTSSWSDHINQSCRISC